MPLSANEASRPLLDQIEIELAALESACAQAERIVASGEADELDRSIMDQRRLTHALANAMDAARDVRTAEYDEGVRNRIRYIGLIRDRHIALLAKTRDEIATRLTTLDRWKGAARKWLSGYNTPRGTGGLDQLR
ncbi:MAG: hypothetical protein M3126_09555 [Candidatus Eremiobacteraeota bacterium]|nr:hypothetical protein [Candidatus Eremiobacteraeota bacterium]